MQTITVKYSCPACGIKDRNVTVPARPRDMDMVFWMENCCIPHTCVDHHTRSPHCHPAKLHDLKVPIDEATGVVGAVPAQ